MILYLIEVISCSIVFLLIYQFAFRNDTFFLRNRIYLLLAPILSFLLPLYQWDFSFLGTSNEFAETLTLAQVQIYSGESDSALNAIWLWLIGTAALGSLAYFIYTSISILKIRNLLKGATKEQFKDYTLVELNNAYEPFSFLKYLFIGKNSNLTEDEKQIIIKHEVAHIKGKHSYDIIYMELLCGLCWFIPLFFIYKKLIKEVHEFIADNEASQTSGTKSYAKLMAQSTLNALSLDLSHNFYQSPVIKRLEMIHKKRTPWVKQTKLLMLVPTILLLTLAFSCDGDEDLALAANGKIESKSIEIDESGEIYEMLKESAMPQEGYRKFYKRIQENLQYPEQAKRMGVSGKVYVLFIVDTDGSISEVKAIRGIGAGCDKEAVRLIEEAGNWTPAIRKGKIVKQRIVLPINFKLN